MPGGAQVPAASCFVPQLICSYVLRPVAFLMGVAWEDCAVVAELLGIKLFLNEFVAYQELSQYKQRRLAGAEEWVGATKQWISVSVPVPALRRSHAWPLPCLCVHFSTLHSVQEWALSVKIYIQKYKSSRKCTF